MSLQEFINKHNGKPLEVEDPSNRDQCMDLAFGWLDYIKVPRQAIRALYAYQGFRNSQFMTKVSKPQPGDLVFWGTRVGFAGHVAIFVSGDANNFVSFDQNWNWRKVCVKVSHNNTGVIGFLRKIGTPPAPTPKPPTPSVIWPKKVTVKTSYVNVRRGPGTNYPNTINASIPAGVLYKGQTIWVYGQVVGQNVSGNAIWYKTVSGSWIWSGAVN